MPIADCRFPVLERFGIDPTWENHKVFMTRFIEAFPDNIHHTIEKRVTDSDNIWALYTMPARIVARCGVWSPPAGKFAIPSWPCIKSLAT